MSNKGNSKSGIVGVAVDTVSKVKEVFNKEKIEANLTKLTDEFTEFAKNCQDVIDYINENVKPEGNLYGEGAAELLKAWIPNIGSAKDFIDNFDNWLTYVRLELEDMKNMDDDLTTNLGKFKDYNKQD